MPIESTCRRFTRCYLVLLLAVICPIAASGKMLFTNPGPGGGSDLWEIAFHPTDPNTFYLGGDIEGPFKTTDGGISYLRVTDGLADKSYPAGHYAAQDIEIDPTQPETVYLATWSGLYKSTDGAASWALLRPDQPLVGGENDNYGAVSVSPLNSNLVIAGSGNPYAGDERLVLHPGRIWMGCRINPTNRPCVRHTVYLWG